MDEYGNRIFANVPLWVGGKAVGCVTISQPIPMELWYDVVEALYELHKKTDRPVEDSES